ncbi:MAG: type II toxin-antitoxin system PemK/MazF family toxin [Gammaproteobacteria bacterium]|nr:type II toxin-antitoxin system PemK/MazF family toxin [Gammaproteobacteria bacterium]
MKRGEIYWVNLNPTKGTEIRKSRPCVIISADPLNEVRRTVVILPLSISAKPRPPLVVAVTCLNKQVSAICDQIRAVDKSRLVKLVDCLSQHDLNMLEESLRQILVLN